MWWVVAIADGGHLVVERCLWFARRQNKQAYLFFAHKKMRAYAGCSAACYMLRHMLQCVG
jgi:hypothetical protein